jgi:hypothetical protein
MQKIVRVDKTNFLRHEIIRVRKRDQNEFSSPGKHKEDKKYAITNKFYEKI